MMKGRFVPVVIWPDLRLAVESAPVVEVNDTIRTLLDDMALTMLFCNGAGLAAPQIGVNLRLVTLKVTKTTHTPACVQYEKVEPPPAFAAACTCGAKPEPEVIYLVNPEVVFASEEQQTNPEGCLSVPNLQLPHERSKVVRVSALGYDGRPLEIGGDGLLAVALLHEIDHLNGVMMVDALSLLKRDSLKRKLVKLKERGLRYRTPEELAEATK